MRDELANSIETSGNVGDDHTGKIIHTLFARSEQRSAILIEKLEKQVLSVQSHIDFLITMADRFYLSLMQYLPDIPEKLQRNVVITATTRHKKWLSEINKIFNAKN